MEFDVLTAGPGAYELDRISDVMSLSFTPRSSGNSS